MNSNCRCNDDFDVGSRPITGTRRKGMALANSFLEAYQRLHRLHEARGRLLDKSVEDK
ncbi:MAG: hypothetical protein AAF438_05995 [Pseudomonadota bacterium]